MKMKNNAEIDITPYPIMDFFKSIPYPKLFNNFNQKLNLVIVNEYWYYF